MVRQKKSVRSEERLLYWAPRILGILAILFLMLFSLDCFGGESALKEQLLCFMMHNIPAFIIIGVLIISWKWELIGGILFLAAALAGSIFFNGFGGNWFVLILMAPFAVAGVLLILHHGQYHKSGG